MLEITLLHAADGYLSMAQALEQIEGYDFHTDQFPRLHRHLVEIVALADDICLSHVPPEMLVVQELIRGTHPMFDALQSLSVFGFTPGELYALVYRHDLTNDSKSILADLTAVVTESGIPIMSTVVSNHVVFRQAATKQVPTHVQ